MKQAKRWISGLLVLCLCLSMVPVRVEAGTGGKSSEDAVAWANNHASKKSRLNYDGSSGAQCVDLIKYYYAFLGCSAVQGDGKDYATNAVPSGWSRIKYSSGFVPQPGDIAIWTTGGQGHGHVAIVISANSSTMTVVEQNWVGEYCSKRSGVSVSGIWGVIRPDFIPLTPPTVANLSINKSDFKIGEEFTLTLSADTYCNFYLSIFDADTGERIIGENVSSTYKNSFNRAGHYNAYMSAFDSNGTGADSNWIDFYVYGSPPTTATLSVDKTQIALGETVTFSTSTDAYYVKIYTSVFLDNASNDGTKVYEGNIPYSFTYTPTENGIYSAYVSAYTHEDGVDSNWVTIHVGKYTVKYDANGGSGAPSSQNKYYGKDITLSTTKPTRTNYNFLGWSTSASATSAAYQPGGKFTSNANTTLYAVWKHVCADGHSYSYKATKNPTTSATGTITGTCSRCSGTTTVTLPKLNTTDYSYKVTKAATCTADGTGEYTWKTTTYGTYKFTVTLGKTGHSYTSKVTTPTCTAQGYTTHTCSSCGNSYKDSYTDALGHSYSYKATKNPTTSATGTITGTCSRCSGTTTVTLPKLNTTDYSYNEITAAGCETEGKGQYTWNTTTYGTYTFDVVIQMTGHQYDAVVTDPTCTEQGYTTYTCSLCSNSYTDAYTDALGHDYTDGICIRCGDKDPDNAIVASGTCGANVDWALYSDGLLLLSGSGPMNDYENGKAPWYALKDQVFSVVLADGITSIGRAAFFGCTNLKSIMLSDSLDRIGELAFFDCAFERIDLPEGLVSIGKNTFMECEALTSVVIPSGVKTIPAGAFTTCSALAQIVLPNSLEVIESGAFSYCASLTSIDIPDTVRSIGSNAFSNCDSLTSVSIPDGVTTINPNTFDDCDRLIEVLLPKSIERIDEDAFRNCRGLKSLSIPENVISIGRSAFSGCNKLEVITLPDGLTTLGEYAFYDCSSLTEISLPEGLTHLRNYTFGRCYNLRLVEIPKTVERIDPGVFNDCSSIEHIRIHSDNPAFCNDSHGVVYTRDMTRLVRATDTLTGKYSISSATTQIDAYAFKNIDGLTEIVIPESVTEIGAYAFDNDGMLTDIYFRGDAPSMGTRAFGNVTATAYYPENNATWTEEYRQATYGGTLTWVPYSTVTEIASGWSGVTQWTLTSDGVLTFFGSGNMKNYGYNGGQPWLSYADQITTVIVGEGITAVGSGAFMGLNVLESVTLPETGLTKIGEAAFYGCSSLKEIDIPDSIYTVFDYTFKNCSALEDVRLSKKLIKVGQGAFENCTSLTYIYIPTNVNIIGSWSFKGCTALVEADMQWADATEIREGAFKNCSALTEIILPNNIQILGDSCFYGIGAEKFTVPATVTAIQPWCFARAYSLTEIHFEGDAPTIGEGAFNKITPTAKYPGDNASWTSAVMQNYGGSITWQAN